MSEVAIYGLTDPVTGELRYVGKAENVKERYSSHLHDGSDSPKALWIRRLKELGLKPGVYLLERCDGETWQEAERRWIAHMETVGASLTNVRAGGEGPPTAKEKRLEERVAYLEAQMARVVLTIAMEQENSAVEYACDACGTETPDLLPGMCVGSSHDRELGKRAGFPLKLEKSFALQRAWGGSSPEWKGGKPPEVPAERWSLLTEELCEEFDRFDPR